MTAHSTFLAPHVQAFFTQHLCQHKQASPQTIASYRDTFRLFLTFVKDTTGREPAALQLSDLDAPLAVAFLVAAAYPAVLVPLGFYLPAERRRFRALVRLG